MSRDFLPDLEAWTKQKRNGTVEQWRDALALLIWAEGEIKRLRAKTERLESASTCNRAGWIDYAGNWHDDEEIS